MVSANWILGRHFDLRFCDRFAVRFHEGGLYLAGQDRDRLFAEISKFAKWEFPFVADRAKETLPSKKIGVTGFA